MDNSAHTVMETASLQTLEIQSSCHILKIVQPAVQLTQTVYCHISVIQFVGMNTSYGVSSTISTNICYLP